MTFPVSSYLSVAANRRERSTRETDLPDVPSQSDGEHSSGIDGPGFLEPGAMLVDSQLKKFISAGASGEAVGNRTDVEQQFQNAVELGGRLPNQ